MFRPWMSLKVRSSLPQGLKYKPKAGHEIKKVPAPLLAAGRQLFKGFADLQQTNMTQHDIA
jgi:hypothetical protein